MKKFMIIASLSWLVLTTNVKAQVEFEYELISACDCPICTVVREPERQAEFQWFFDRWNEGSIVFDVTAANASGVHAYAAPCSTCGGLHPFDWRAAAPVIPKEVVIDSRTDPAAVGELESDELPPWVTRLTDIEVPSRWLDAWIKVRTEYPTLRYLGPVNALSPKDIDERFEMGWQLIRSNLGTNIRALVVRDGEISSGMYGLMLAAKRKGLIFKWPIAEDPKRAEIVAWSNGELTYVVLFIRPGPGLTVMKSS